MPDNLGRSAEKRFGLLCSDAGVTCNVAHEDDNGWDCVIEFPHVPVAGIPTDRQVPTPAVFVQIKSHVAADRSVRLKLDNALRFARSPNPCFVVLMTPGGPDGGPMWWAAHFWRDLMERTLRRVREAERDGVPEDDLHGLSLSFSMTDADVRPEPDLVAWIMAELKAVGSDYAGAKGVLRASLGYGPDRVAGILRIGPLDSIEELLDHQLGLTPSIPMRSIEINDRRFGIDLPMPMPDGEITFARLHLHPSARSRVRLVGPDGLRIEADGDLFVASIPGEDQGMKARFAFPFLDIVRNVDGSASMGGRISTGERTSPEDVLRSVRFMSWAGLGPIHVTAWADGRRLLGGVMHIDDPGDAAACRLLIPIVETLVDLVTGGPGDAPTFSIEDVDMSRDLRIVHVLMTASSAGFAVELEGAGPLPMMSRGVALATATVGEWILGAVLALPIEEATRQGQTARLRAGRASVVERYRWPRASFDPEDMIRDYDRALSMPGAVPLGDLPALLRVIWKLDEPSGNGSVRADD